MPALQVRVSVPVLQLPHGTVIVEPGMHDVHGPAVYAHVAPHVSVCD